MKGLDIRLFGERLKNHRKELGLTQEEVAEHIGVSGQAVSKWENGDCLPDCWNLKLLGDLYHVSLDILLDTDTVNSFETVVGKVRQLVTEYVWSKYSRQDDTADTHMELGMELWQLWKAIYYVEIGNRELQEWEEAHASNRIVGPFGAKFWDDGGGIACVVQSRLREKLDGTAEKDIEELRSLLDTACFQILRLLDVHEVMTRNALTEQSGLDAGVVSAILLDLTEKGIIEYFGSLRDGTKGYRLTIQKGTGVYVLFAALYMLAVPSHSFSAYFSTHG